MIEPLRTLTESSANRIALSTALRGTVATLVPLLVLPTLGASFATARFAVLGGLHASMVDVGGAYRSRLETMVGFSLAAPACMTVGMELGATWWAAGLAMLIIAFAGGLLRAAGAGGGPFGLNTSVAFLIGLQAPVDPSGRYSLILGYLVGTVWTIAVALLFWRLRPLRRLEQEVASAWEALASLVDALEPWPAGERSVIARRRHEQLAAGRHKATRDAIERARAALGATRADTEGPEGEMAQLLVLIRAASRIAAAIVTLDEIEGAGPLRDQAARTMLIAAVAEIKRACGSVARALLDQRSELDLTALHARLSALTAAADAGAADRSDAARTLEPRLIAIAQAVRHFDGAEEAVQAVISRPNRAAKPALWRPAGAQFGLRRVAATIAAQLTPRSAVFRHALRVALVAAIGAAGIVLFNVPHGLWLPMSAVLILQPDFGGTLSRALERTLGTIVGAGLAGLLLIVLNGMVMFDVAIAVLLFATFLLLRRRYSWGIAFLTPLIILLLGIGGHDSRMDLVFRVFDTAAGALLAIIAGYAAWPLWQRDDLGPITRAISAGRTYAVAALDALGGESAPSSALGELRRDAEIAAMNADAAFRRMLADPRHRRGRIAPTFALTIYVQRLVRHAIALAGYAGAAAVPKESLRRLRDLLDASLHDMVAALIEGRSPQPRPNFDEPLEHIRTALTALPGAGDAIAFLLGQIVADTSALQSAVDTKWGGEGRGDQGRAPSGMFR